MIKLVTMSKDSFHLIIDKKGTECLINYLSAIEEKRTIYIRQNNRIKSFSVVVMQEANNIAISNNNIILELDEEELEYFLERLYVCNQNGLFYPAELCEKVLKKNEVSIYVIFEQ